MTDHPPDPVDMPSPSATSVDPAQVVDVPEQPAERKSWWGRVSAAIAGGAFTNVAAALIAVTGAIYIGMVHAPWVNRVLSRVPATTQAVDAVTVATAAGPASAATPTQAAQADSVAAARDRMEQRVYAQVPPSTTRTVAETDTVNDGAPVLDSGGPATGAPRRHHRGMRHTRHARNAWDARWYNGA